MKISHIFKTAHNLIILQFLLSVWRKIGLGALKFCGLFYFVLRFVRLLPHKPKNKSTYLQEFPDTQDHGGGGDVGVAG
jgi:hypothetical protein